MAAELECGVCLSLPEGEVHQCNEGHCYCVTCWRVLDPRRCPECRQPIQDNCRNRAQEARIAALEATCEHCAEMMTRGTMAAHLRACPQRPTACAGAEAGCGWSGVASGQAAHEAACPITVCQRMMVPLQARCDGLQAQNQLLQQRVVALAGQVRALEGDTEAGGRRQRQRVGAAPHDAPPSSAAVQGMGVAAAVAALQAHVAVARVAEEACHRVAALCRDEEGNRQPAADAGMFEAVVAAMQAHPQVAGVQAQGCTALGFVCRGGLARKQRAAEAGALEAVVAAMQAHPQAAVVQQNDCTALGFVCYGTDAAALARKQRAVEAGALEAAVAAMQAHPQVAGVQDQGFRALHYVCYGTDAAALARKQRAAGAGALEAAVAAMQAHRQVATVQLNGCAVLGNVFWGADAAAPARRQRAVAAGGRGAAAAAMQAHPGNADVQRVGSAVINGLRE